MIFAFEILATKIAAPQALWPATGENHRVLKSAALVLKYDSDSQDASLTEQDCVDYVVFRTITEGIFIFDKLVFKVTVLVEHPDGMELMRMFQDFF